MWKPSNADQKLKGYGDRTTSPIINACARLSLPWHHVEAPGMEPVIHSPAVTAIVSVSRVICWADMSRIKTILCLSATTPVWRPSAVQAGLRHGLDNVIRWRMMQSRCIRTPIFSRRSRRFLHWGWENPLRPPTSTAHAPGKKIVAGRSSSRRNSFFNVEAFREFNETGRRSGLAREDRIWFCQCVMTVPMVTARLGVKRLRTVEEDQVKAGSISAARSLRKCARSRA